MYAPTDAYITDFHYCKRYSSILTHINCTRFTVSTKLGIEASQF